MCKKKRKNTHRSLAEEMEEVGFAEPLPGTIWLNTWLLSHRNSLRPAFRSYSSRVGQKITLDKRESRQPRRRASGSFVWPSSPKELMPSVLVNNFRLR